MFSRFFCNLCVVLVAFFASGQNDSIPRLEDDKIYSYKNKLLIAQKKNDTKNVLSYYDSITRYYSTKQLYLDSLELYTDKAIHTAQQLDNDEMVIKYKYIYATHFIENNSLSTAYKKYLELEPIISSSDYSFKPEFMTNFARVNYLLGYNEVALDYLKRSAATQESRGNLRATSVVYNNLGIIYKSLNQIDSSLLFHNKSLELNVKLKDTVAISQSYNNIGYTFLNLRKDTIKAMEFYEKSLKINPHEPTGAFVNNYADILYRKGQLDDAETMLESYVLSTVVIDHKIDALGTLAQINKKKGDYKKALECTLIKEDLEKIRIDETRAKEIETLKNKFELEKKEQQISQLKENTRLQELANNQKRVLITILVIAFVLLMIAGALYLRNKQTSASKEKLKLEQRLLRAQMNPHFIFNTLGAIQSFILEKNNKAAITYLSKFSKLIRIILDNSMYSFVSFETELIAIKNYLKLQQLRFNNSFTYNIQLNEALNDDLDVQIPPMLFQPFVENSIEHGFRNNIKHGVININFKLHENLIHCEIIDNGIGRVAASQLNDKKKSSLSSRITEERLILLGLKEDSIQIIDLDKGTQVKLKIPTQNYVSK